MSWYTSAAIGIIQKKFPSQANLVFDTNKIYECIEHFEARYGQLSTSSIVYFLIHLVRRLDQVKDPEYIWPYIIPALLVAYKTDYDYKFENFYWQFELEELNQFNALLDKKCELEKSLTDAETDLQEEIKKEIVEKDAEIMQYRVNIKNTRALDAGLSSITLQTINEMERVHLTALNYRLGISIAEIAALRNYLAKDQYEEFINYSATRDYITKHTGTIIENIRTALDIASVFLESDLQYLVEKANTILLRLESVNKILLTTDDFKLSLNELKNLVDEIISEGCHPNYYNLFFRFITQEQFEQLDHLLMDWATAKVNAPIVIMESQKKIKAYKTELLTLESEHQKRSAAYKEACAWSVKQKSMVAKRFMENYKQLAVEVRQLENKITDKKAAIAELQNVISEQQAFVPASFLEANKQKPVLARLPWLQQAKNTGKSSIDTMRDTVSEGFPVNCRAS